MHRSAAELLLRQTALGVAGATCAGLLMACAALHAATSPAPSGGDVGYLEGLVTIGPLRPVEQVGVPPPAPPPDLCTSLGFVVATPDGLAEVARFAPRPDCTFRVALKPGAYLVRFEAGGLRRARGLPTTIQIAGGKTTRLDVSIDTGIR